MRKNCPFIITVICLMVSEFALSRPISYPGGWTSIVSNTSRNNALNVHYSPTAKYSIGYRAEYMREREFVAHTLQLNNLVKRWNGPAYQGNLYLQSGIGVGYGDGNVLDDIVEPVVFSGIAAEWENRRWFFSYQNRYTEAGDLGDFFMQTARIGLAPYIGDYGDLNTWLMLDIDHSPESSDSISVTPLIRFLKGANLIEAGLNTDGKILFNWVRQY